MKRLVVLMLAAMLTFAMAAPASALEVTVRGDMHFTFYVQDKMAENFRQDVSRDTFFARSRVRTTIEFIASENIKGVLGLQTGNNNWWGYEGAAAGGSFNTLDGNSKALQISHAYIDWNMVNAPVNVKVGLQQIGLPAAVAGNPVFNTSVAAVMGTFKANDNVSVSAFWGRPYNGGAGNNAVHDAWDMFGLIVPIQFDGVKITPWAQYSTIGGLVDYAPLADNAVMNDGYDYWHAGVAVDIDVTDALNIKGDFIYGALQGKKNSTEASGFWTTLKVSYDIGMGKLALAGWYSSGADKNDHEKNNGAGDFGFMPSLHYQGEATPGFTMSTMGGWGNPAQQGGAGFSNNYIGTWGAALMWENFSFITDLSHTLRLIYVTGTNDKQYIGARETGLAGNAAGKYILTEKDNGYEIDFDTTYQIYKNFRAIVGAGIMYVDWDKDWRDGTAGAPAATMWRVGLGLYYNF